MNEEEEKISTLIELLTEYEVEIPKVQRDYAQGRRDSHSKMVRRNILKDIKKAIVNEEPIDFSFVYGKKENKKFIPVDGQQRLTTIFLLHLYAFSKDETKTEMLHKFTYETRESSRKFFKELVDNREEIFAEENELSEKNKSSEENEPFQENKPSEKNKSSEENGPSKKIEDSEWFLASWENDPTIQSALVMLDEMKEEFNDVENLANKLLDKNNKLLTFKFLEMDDLGKEDDLYIKLNARGRSLTNLENFKALLIGRMRELQIDYITDFEHNFDGGIWTDFFWNKYTNEFDDYLYSFFEILLINNDIIEDNQNWINKIDYSKINKDIIDTAYYTLNYLCKETANEEIVNTISEALQKNKQTYVKNVLFHVITLYLFKTKGIEEESFRQWFRITKNLILNNNNIDNKERYRSAINSVEKLANNWDNLLEFFATGEPSVDFFEEKQVEEEQKKAKIILKDSSFADEIYKAEKNEYFCGQIRSALYLSKVGNEYDKEIFKKYWEKISALFDDSKPKYGNLLRRALLTFEDYTIDVNAFKTLCVDDPKEFASNPSLKTLFSNHYEKTRKLLDTIDVNEDIKMQLTNIVNNSNVEENDWRYCLIEYPELFKKMSPTYLRLRVLCNEMHIIPNKRANGYNYNIFLAALYEEIGRRKESNLEFDEQLGGFVTHYLLMGNYKIYFGDKKFCIKNENDEVVFESTTDKPITETADFIVNNL